MPGASKNGPHRVSTRGSDQGSPQWKSTGQGPSSPGAGLAPQRGAATAAQDSSKRTRTRAENPPQGRWSGPTGLKGRAKRKAIRSEFGFFNYPRKQYRGLHKWLPSWRVILWMILLIGALGIGAFVWAYNAIGIPDAGQFATAQKTTVYYSDGKTVMGDFATQDRVIVDGKTLPAYVGQSFVAAEDRTFFDNNGVSLPGMTRALINNLSGGAQQGGSTITQQYAERYYLGETKSYTGKFKEGILALKLARHQDKNEVLANYMNTIYLGRGTYGIQSAAQRYFGVDAKNLTLEQSALIAGIVPAPSLWDPRLNPAKAEMRWNYVMDGLVTLGFITPAQRAAAVMPETIEFKQSETYRGTRGYLLQMVRNELIARGGMTDDDIDTRGLSITTTIDKSMQADIVRTVRDMPADTPKRLRPAMVSIDPGTGGIKALYGGKNYLDQAFNNVTQGVAQAGSTFKPFALLAAVKEGKSITRDYYNGNSGIAIKGFDKPVVNFARASYGSVNLQRATALSINTAYAALNVEIGPDKTMAAAIAAGLPKDTTGLNALPSNVLGTASVHPIDLANAYATIAAGGIHRRAHIITSAVERQSGDVVYKPSTKGERVFDEDVAATVVNAMTAVTDWGSAAKAKEIDRPTAGKTGTSSDNKSAWFAGFTPNLVTVVGLSQSNKTGGETSISPFGGYREITGGSVPLDMWVAYMEKALADLPEVDFPDLPRPKPQKPTDQDSDKPTETDKPKQDDSDDAKVKVPGGLEGSSEGAAASKLRDAGLSVTVSYEYSASVGKGQVISASHGGGSSLARGAAVHLVVSRGPEPKNPPDNPEPGGGDNGGGGGTGGGGTGGGSGGGGTGTGSTGGA